MAQSLKTRLKPRNGYKIVTKEELMLPKTFVPNWPDKRRRNTSTCESPLTKVAQSLKTRLKPRNGYKIVTKEELMLPKTFVPQWPDKRRRNTRIASDINQERFKLILSLRPFVTCHSILYILRERPTIIPVVLSHAFILYGRLHLVLKYVQ